MALKKINRVTYVTDRGIEINVKEMETTHLINAICHHSKQRDVLKEYTQDCEFNTNLSKRVDLLNETINVLLDELEQRDPDKDHMEDEEADRIVFGRAPRRNREIPYG